MVKKTISTIMILFIVAGFVSCKNSEPKTTSGISPEIASVDIEEISEKLQGSWDLLSQLCITFENDTVTVSMKGGLNKIGDYTILTDQSTIDVRIISDDSQLVTMHIPYQYEDGNLKLFNSEGIEFTKL